MTRPRKNGAKPPQVTLRWKLPGPARECTVEFRHGDGLAQVCLCVTREGALAYRFIRSMIVKQRRRT